MKKYIILLSLLILSMVGNAQMSEFYKRKISENFLLTSGSGTGLSVKVTDSITGGLWMQTTRNIPYGTSLRSAISQGWLVSTGAPSGSNSWTISGNNIYNSNSGNVGVGTTSVNAWNKFQVDGEVGINGRLRINESYIIPSSGGAPGQYLTIAPAVGPSPREMIWTTPSGASYTAGYRLGLSGTVFYNTDIWKNQDSLNVGDGIIVAADQKISAIPNNSANWNTAYSWGNHAGLYTSSTLTSGSIYVGNGSNVATAVAMSGDATLANTGAISVNKTRLNVRNETGVAITTTKAVYTTGFNNLPLILLADNTNEAKHNFIGVTVGTINNQANGYVATSGQCDAETNAWTVGTELYLSTAGTLTPTEPTSGAVEHVGIVTVQANYPTGKLLIYARPEGNTMATGSAQDAIIRVGDAVGVNKTSFRNYTNTEKASINSNGDFNTNGNINADSAIVAGYKDNGNSGTAINIYATQGNYQKVTRTGSCTYTIIGMRTGQVLTIEMVHEASANVYTCTFSPTLKFPGGTAPTWTNTSGAIDTISIRFDGTNYLAQQTPNYQ